jgi:poly(3-hydroxybutyrate) depolymerase
MFFNANYLYSAMEFCKLQSNPMREGIKGFYSILKNPYLPGNYSQIGKNYEAIFEILERLSRTYHSKKFDVNEIIIDDKKVAIAEMVVFSKPFCDLIHFHKLPHKSKQPKLLIVAPLAGHHANLLTDAISFLSISFDVYVTSWKSASQVPLKDGSFNMDDYIDYIIEFARYIGEGLNIMAVCQPTVPVLAATSLLAEQDDPCTPNSLVLMGGPIDARQNPTEVNKFALKHDIKWFESSLITVVPANYPGFLRKVYPGFLQLMGFLSLNFEKHVQSHIDFFNDLINNNTEEAEKHRKFYNRYFTVLDLAAEFYLQTIEEIFHKFSLAKGNLISRNRAIDPSKIKNTTLLCIEGEKDDITGIGQTKAALDLCKSLPDNKKLYHLQGGVGHYGIFSGGKFRRNIAPVITEFIYSHSKN